MNAWATIGVAAVAAAAGRWAVTRTLHADAPSAVESGALADARAELARVRAENESLARALAERSGGLVAAPMAARELDEADIASALERWRAAHPSEVQRTAAERPKPAPTAAELDFARVPIDDLVRELMHAGLGNVERQELFERLRKSGRLDEYVARIEQMAAKDPNDADLQVALGTAYLQKLFGVDAGPEQGVWAYKSDAAFDRALAIDDHNWAARFTKAVALSNWPDFMGRGPEAVENFEELLDQQDEVAPRPEFALTYLFLGNLHQANGERDKAIAVWREGLARFPDVEELRRALELAGVDGR